MGSSLSLQQGCQESGFAGGAGGCEGGVWWFSLVEDRDFGDSKHSKQLRRFRNWCGFGDLWGRWKVRRWLNKIVGGR